MRLAPTFASFDPTDLAAIDHVKRLYNKYPKMWRGIGELMCRHDDLTMMLLDKEVRSQLMTFDDPLMTSDDPLMTSLMASLIRSGCLPPLSHRDDAL